MFRISLKGLWAHKRRLVGTVLAVFLGVAFLTGTFVLNATMDDNFETLFSDAVGETDVEVRAEQVLDVGDDLQAPALVDESLVDEIRSVEGVAAVEASVQGFGQLIASDGDPIGGQGPPTFAGSWVEEDGLSTYRLAEGREPEAPGEVVINRGAADDGDLSIGDTTTVNTPDPVEVEIVGISTFAEDADGLGAVTFAAFSFEEAQRVVAGSDDQVSRILVSGEEGVSQDALADRVDRVLPDGVETVTADALVDENIDDINQDFLGFFQAFLVVFAAIALLVAAFSINNTFSILVAQRTRDGALLRALGATRRQVLVAMAGEAVALGIVASAIGVLGGMGLAFGLKTLFTAFGFPLPTSGLVVTTGSIVTGLLVGTLVTAAAGLMPAVRASRVSPLAALRDVSVDRTGASTVRLAVGGLLLVGGVSLILTAVFGGGGDVIAVAGLGAIATIFGVVTVGPVVARPAASILGWPVARTRGITGSLARENAMRNPRRTAATASALMVGVGVVTLFTVFAGSLKSSFDEGVNESFGGDLVITSNSFDAGQLSPEIASTVDELPEVDRAVGVGIGGAAFDGSSRVVTVADPTELAAMVDADEASGSLADLGDDGFAALETRVEDEGWELGQEVDVTFADGVTETLTLESIYRQGDIVGEWVLPRDVWEPHATQSVDFTVLIDVGDRVSIADGKAAVESAVAAFGDPEVMDREEYVDSASAMIDQVLGLIYVMLVLAIIIALMGIANTLSLSTFERTRELGLLRAVGQTRPQLRSMVRWESVLIAVFGTLGGIGLGVFLGWALFQAAVAEEGFGTFSLAVGPLIPVLLVGSAAGVLAGWRPARRAARLDVLAAVAHE